MQMGVQTNLKMETLHTAESSTFGATGYGSITMATTLDQRKATPNNTLLPEQPRAAANGAN